jgi:hypothetical protein
LRKNSRKRRAGSFGQISRSTLYTTIWGTYTANACLQFIALRTNSWITTTSKIKLTRCFVALMRSYATKQLAPSIETYKTSSNWSSSPKRNTRLSKPSRTQL